MEGPQVRLNLAEFKKALSEGDKQLTALIKKSLADTAERHQMEVKLLYPLVEEILERVKEESKRFSNKLPYPPIHVNNLSVQLVLPVQGKVGVCEFNTAVVV